MLSARKAAKRLACAPDYVGKLCREGKLEGERINNAWFVKESSIAAFEKSRASARMARAQELAEERQKEQEVYRKTKGLRTASFLHSAAGKSVAFVLGGTFLFASLVYAGGIATPFESPLETGGSSQGAAVLASVQSPFFAAPPQTPNLAVPSSNNFFASVLAFLFGNHSSQTVAVSPAQPVSPTPVSAVTTSTPAPVVSEKSSGRLGSLNQTFPQQQAPASTQTLPQSAPAPIANLSSYVTQDALTTQLNELSNNLRQVIFSNINSAPGPVYSSGGNTNNIALSQIIDRLSNVVITGGSITGANISGGSISGLNGIDLASGCFSVAGVCITSGGNAAGSTGAIQFNTGGAFDASSTEFVWDAVNNRLGVGTANPTQTLSLGNGGVISIASNDGSSNGCFAEIAGQLEYSNDCSSYQSFTASAAGGWTDTGTVVHLTTNNEQVGIGTTTPYAKLTVWGVGLGNENAFEIANSASTTLFAVNDAGQTTLVNLLATGGTTLQQVTATNATTSVLYASTFGLGAGNYFTSLLGTGLSNNAGVLTVSTTSLGLLAPSSLSATAPLAYNSTTGAFSILQSGLASNGYLSSTDFTTFNNKISSSSLSGTNGVTYNGATGAIGLGTIGIANGGTGTGTAPSYGQLLVGNSTGGYNLLATSSLGIIGGGGGTFTSIGPASQLQSGPSVTLASSTLGNDFSITASGNLITYNLPSASLGARGLLTPADYATFENKISSSSLSGANGITYNGGTGVIGLGTIGVVNGGTGTSTAPVYGQLLLGNAAGGYSLVSTSSLGIAASGNPSWGNIVGTLSNQTDLQNALNAKLNLSDWYATTTDGLKQGITNLYYNNALVNAFIDASSTIPKTYTANIFSNANTFNGATSLQNLSVTGTGTSTFAGNIGISGSIIPSVANTYSLGSAANTWKDIYVGPGSLYVNGQEVLHTDASNDVVVSSDVNENLVMQTTGTANIEINPSGTGALLIKSGVTLTGGKSFNTSDSSAVLFPSGTLAGNIQISGSTISVPSLTNGGISISPNGNGGTYITNGNFGVDTTNPTQALSVNGSAYISNNLTTANITATGTLQVSGNTTLAQATTTNLAISNITSTLLKTNANGSVVPAVAGTDYQAPGGYLTSAVTSLAATYPLQVSGSTGAVTLSTNFGTTTANLYSSLQTFGAGFVSQASSTIGNGTQTGGLTIAGGATTTGALQVNGGITVNGSLKLASVTGSVQCLHVGANGIISGTGSDCGTGGGGGSSTFLGLTDVPSSYVANQVYYTNATADAVTASNNFTFDGTTLTAPTVSASTLTISGSSSFGTIIAGVWNGTPIANAYVAHNLTINGGSIDNSPIGANTPSTGVFTNATSTNLAAYQSASFGATATSSFANNGALTLSQALGIGSGGTGTSTAPSYGQLLLGNGTGGYNLISTSSLGINSATWGNISGTLASQTDLQNALNAKLNISDEIGYPFPNNATSTKLNLSGGVQVGALTGFIGGNNGTLYGIASSSLNLPNAALQNSSLTINGTTFNLGDNKTITAASSTVLTDSNTFSGNNIFTNLITGSVSGNAGTVTNGVYTTTFGNLFDNRLSASSSIAGITTLPNLASINNYSGLIAGNSGKLYQVSTSSLNASITGNAGTVTNGVYTTDTGTVTNTMLAGSIANNKLVNSSITVNGTTFNLGDNKIIPMSSTTLLTDTNTFSGVNNFTNASSNFAGTWQGLSASNFDTFAYPFIANATSSQIAFNGGFTASTILATASTTLQNFTGVNATTTNATTTSFAISNIVSGILATNANGSVRPLTVGSGLTFDGTTLTTNGIGITSIGPAGQTQNGGTQLLATSTNGTDFTITASGNTQTFNLPFASLTSNGKLSLADYATFNNKLSSSSLSGGNGINYVPSTGIITNTGVISLTATYPLQTSASTGNLTISTAFGTTTNNVFSGTNTFNAASAFTAFASFANASSSQISAATGFFNYLNATSSTATSTFAGGLAVGSNALTVLQNGTVGIGNSTPGKTLDVTGTGRFSSTLTLSGSPSCTGNQALQTDSQGNVVCGALAIANASTGGGWTTNNIGTVSLATTTDMVAVGATTTPYAKLTVLSSNTASTTLALVAASGQTANVIDIYNSTGALNSVFTSAGNFGLGSTSPAAKLGVNGNGFFAGNLTATGALNVGGNTLVATAGGNVGLGSSTPASHLAIAGGDITHVAAGNPSIAATVSEIGSAHAYGTYVSGHYAYVADYQGGLRVIDITNPAVPTTVGSNSSYIASPAADAVVVAGKYAYVADQNFGLVIFDVSNPAAPNAVGTYALSGTTQSLALSGRYLYINDFNNHAVRIIDVSNPAAPTLAGSLLPPGGTNSLPIALAISGKYLYVGDQLPAIYVVDVSNPAAPAIVGTYNNSSVVGGPAAMYVSGKYLYVADQVTGLYTLSVSNPASPALVGQYPPSHSAYYNGVQAAGTNLYVADHSGNTLVLDMSTPTAPSLVGSIASAGTPNSIFVAGKYAYVADDSHGLDVVDINGLSTPAANIGSLAANSVDVSDSLNVGQNIFAGGGLDVGAGGIFSRGGFAALGSTTLGASLMVSGSTTLQNFTALNATTTNATSTSLFASTFGLGAGSYFTSLLGAGLVNVNGALTVSTSSLSLFGTSSLSAVAPLAYNSSTGAFAISQAGLASNGYLSSTDYNTFNNKISSTSLSGGAGIGYVPSTGVITNTGVVSLAATYPLQTSASTGNLTISTAFGTTTNTGLGNNLLVYTNNSGVFIGASTSTLNIGGNANTATALQNPRTINGVSFNGTANIVIASTTLLGDSNTFSGNNTFSNLITGSVSGNAATVTTNANLTGVVTSVGNTTSFATSPTFTGTLTVPNLLATASSTFQNFTGVNATTTNATTTSFAISNIASGNLLKTTTGGALVAAVAGVDYSPAGADTFAYPFPLNATSTKLNFSGGVQVGTLAGFIGANSGTLYQIASSSLNLPNAALQNSSLTINGTAVSLGGSITVASTTLLADNNTFSGNDTFNNTITGSVSGNAATVTNGVYTGTFNGLFDPRFITDLAATTSVNSITALSNLASVGTITSGIWNGTAIGDSYIASAANWNTAYSDRITSATYPLSISSNVISTVATSSLNLTTSSFLSPNISQWTNNAGYLTSLSGAASSTLLGDTNTWSGTDIFNNLITGSISGNAGTATKLAATKTINSVAFDGSANITITAASSSLLGDFNTFSGTDYFNNPIKIGTLGGLIAGNGGLTYAVSTTSMNASITGNAGTATALASAPTKCSAGNYTLGIDVNGNAQGCTAAGTGTVTQVNTNYSMTGGGFTTSGTLAVATSSLYTGLTGGLPYFSGTNTFGAIAAGTGGYVLSMSGGIPAWVATSSINNGVTSITASAPLTGGTITTTGSIGCTTASSGVAGCLGSTAFDTFNNKQAALSTPTYPLLLTGTTLSTAFGTTTNSGMTAGNLYVGSNGVFQTSASSSIFGYTPLNPTRNVNTTYPLQGGGALTGDLTLTSAFGTTTTWGMGNNGLVMTGSTGIPFSQATSSAIAMSISGNAATVTTNANLTGVVTSVGNAASLGSFTSANLSTALTDETGTGGVAVFSASPTITGTLGAAAISATGFINTSGTTGGYQIDGNTVLYASSTTHSVQVGQGAGNTSNVNAAYNVIVGYNNGNNITTGADNVLLGGYAFGSHSNLTSGSNNISLGYDISLPSATANNQLDIGNLIYGTTVNGTGSTLSTGNIGIGTANPQAKLDVQGTASSTNLQVASVLNAFVGAGTNGLLYGIASSSLNLPNSALQNSSITINGTLFNLGDSHTITAASSTLLTDANTFSGINNFTNASSNFAGTWQNLSPSAFDTFGNNWNIVNGYLTPTTTLGIILTASSTIGNGTQAGGLTISGGATTTGNLSLPAGAQSLPSLNFGATSGYNTGIWSPGAG
ncbi:MAG TPA: hypothetical protein VMR46_01370, partial [Candidatus Paceibacterota bacterium]|nr:hypothetical protein [Candidatus Paceibacterota bacterium]